MDKKSQKNIHDMDPIYSSIVYAFAKAYGLDDAFMKVDPYSDWGIFSPYEDKKICDKYGACSILFYECTFSTMYLCLLFTLFEIEALKHLVMAPLQLYPTCWAYMQIYQY